jgi:uncharacterized surface protein with fasciclin (FAS1) repeats
MSSKFFSIVLLMLVLLLTAGGANAQDEMGSIRVVQIFYSDADVYLDDELIVPNLTFTVATDYLPVAVGEHSVAISAAGAGLEAATATTINVVAEGRYTVLTMGEFEVDTPELLIVDETTTFAEADPRGNNAIIVQNLPKAIPVDVWFGDDLKIENLTFGTYGAATAPLGQFKAQAVVVGDRSKVIFESQYFAVPGTLSLAYLSGVFPDGINRTFFTTTDDNLLEYLTAHASLENSSLTTLYELIELAGVGEMLNGDTEYTIFAPTNTAFDALPEGTLDALKADPAALIDLLSYHVSEGRWGPYELTGEHILTSVQGGTLEVAFQPIEQPLAVNGITTGLQHRTRNGIIYLIDSVLLPGE